MLTKYCIEQYLDEMEKREKIVSEELIALEKDKKKQSLSVITQNGKPTFLLTFYQDGKRMRKALKNNSNELKTAIRLEALKLENKALNNNILELRKVTCKLTDECEYHKIFEYLSNKYLLINEAGNLITDALANKDYYGWDKFDYEELNFKNEDKKHLTSNGIRVRTKSEVLIAEMLNSNGIAYRYEEVIHVGEKIIAPDFTIMRNDGKVFYWEHQGLTNSEEYLRKQRKKEELYTSIGIVPWDNLIVTYDSKDGNIDIRIIESEIKNKLIV